MSARRPHSLKLLVLTDAIQAAIEQLDLLGAVERKEDQLVLTPLGRKMAAFPLEPKFSKVKTTEKLANFYLTYSSQYHWHFSSKLLKRGLELGATAAVLVYLQYVHEAQLYFQELCWFACHLLFNSGRFFKR